MQNNRFSGDVDPDIANLFGIEKKEALSEDAIPDYGTLFPLDRDAGDQPESDLSVRTFRRPERIEEGPKPFFSDKDFYKKVLSGGGDLSRRLHDSFTATLQCQDPQERANHRQRIIPIFWDYMSSLAPRAAAGDLPSAKQLFMRFAVLLPAAAGEEQCAMLSRIIMENLCDEPIYYVDEWIGAVARGRVNASATDETALKSKQGDRPRINSLLEKARGKYDAQLSLVRNRIGEMEALENDLRERVGVLCEHERKTNLHNLKAPYNDVQRGVMNEMVDILRKLGAVNRDLGKYYSDLDMMRDQLDSLKEKDAEAGAFSVVDHKLIVDEMNAVRQMAKLCIGRQGNHFPVLLKQYLRPDIFDLGTRENIVNILADIEYLDPGLFLRTFKQQTNRIVPNIVVIPCYGENGVCWEPFERFNRATSRGRLALPLYPKDLRTAVLTACADLRWQVAKEKAQHYWMEEGLTGWYYQAFTERRMKGDVRESFIQDYVLWISKESEGTQKLDKEIRAIFWRYIPFPQDIKEKLRNRGFVYAELCKKDQNRAMSDGY